MGGGKDKHKPNPSQNPDEEGQNQKENITTKDSVFSLEPEKNSMVCT